MLDIVQQLKQKPLVDFFETHLNISLIKQGSKYRCLCPIHVDSNPSFFIDPLRNKCSCYGACGLINGDIFDFAAKYKSFSFNESVNWLATKYKIPTKFKQNTVTKTENEEYYDICNFVANFYSSNIQFKKPCAKLGIEYLRSRKLIRGVVRDFNIGYAPSPSECGTWTYLVDELKQEGFDLELCETLGLIKKSEKGNYYDLFRGRIICPIYDLNDRCIGFNTRIVFPVDDGPKYLVSKESPIFKKSNFIYGLNKSLKYIKQQDICYIVEGCFDCYAMWKFDYPNTVPLLGGKLYKNLEIDKDNKENFTKEFCGLPEVSNYIILMDPDKAGIKYSIEIGSELIKKEKNVLICELKKGTDPDDCTKEEIDGVIRNAKSFLDFYLKYNFHYNTDEHKLQILDKLSIILNGISKEQMLLYAKQLSIKMEIPVSIILFRFGLENKLQYEEIFTEMMKYNK